MESKTVNIPNIQTPDVSDVNVRLSIESYINNLRVADVNVPQNATLLDFFELLQKAIRSKEASEGIPEQKRILALAKDPPEEIDTEAITFYLKSRMPGSISQGPATNAKVREVVSHVRSITDHPEHPGEKLVTMGRISDNIVGVNVYAQDDFIALKRVLWIENLIEGYRWYFRVHRVPQIIQLGVGEKEQITVGGLLLTKYPMSYFVRTEDITQFGSQELISVELNITC